MKNVCKIKVLGRDVLVERCDLEGDCLLGQVIGFDDGIKIQIEQKLVDGNFLSTLHHELFEWVLNSLRVRYNNSDDNKGDFFFMFDHSELTTICDVVQGAYEEIKEKMEYGKKTTRKRTVKKKAAKYK